MRLVHIFLEKRHAVAMSHFLQSKEIENVIEKEEKEKDKQYAVWIVDEREVKQAQQLLSEFLQDPNHKKYYKHEKKDEERRKGRETKHWKRKGITYPSQKEGVFTYYLIFLCIILFFVTTPMMPRGKNGTYVPSIFSPYRKPFLFDYPRSYELGEELVTTYGIKSFQEPEKLPEKGQKIYEQYSRTPFWLGLYHKVLFYLKGTQHKDVSVDATLFEKIREGHFWRLFTPIVLHHDLLHLGFNMLWLYVLGRQIETRIKVFRYLLMILTLGVFSNIAQYLMSGPNFIGFSGVLCGMIMFVWVRQKDSVWEGYQLAPSSFQFVSFFVLGIALLQSFLFVLEASNIPVFPLPIANTAHLSGAFAGYLMGKTPFFARKI